MAGKRARYGNDLPSHGIDRETQKRGEHEGEEREAVRPDAGCGSSGHVQILIQADVDDRQQRIVIGAETAQAVASR
jgi:hypothetical protein